jgi:hypothetical protein
MKTAVKDSKDVKAFEFAKRLQANNYLDINKLIILDKNLDCHLCDESLSKVKNLIERGDKALYNIRLDENNEIHLFRTF